MKARNLTIGLIVTILSCAILLAILWNGLTFTQSVYNIPSKKASVTISLAIGDKVSLGCFNSLICKGNLKLLRSNFTLYIQKGQAITVPRNGNYSLNCLNGTCVFNVKSANTLTLAIRYTITGLGVIVLVFSVALFKASIYSKPARNFIIIGKYIECHTKTLRKHTCVIKPVKGIGNLFDVVLDYLIKKFKLKLLNRKKFIALLKERTSWEKAESVVLYSLKDGSVELEFTFSGLNAKGAEDLERISKKLKDLENELEGLEH